MLPKIRRISQAWSFRRSFPFLWGGIIFSATKCEVFRGKKYQTLLDHRVIQVKPVIYPRKWISDSPTFLPSKVKKLPLLRKVTKTFLKSQAEKTPGFSDSKRLMRNNWLPGTNPWPLDLLQTARFHCLFGT